MLRQHLTREEEMLVHLLKASKANKKEEAYYDEEGNVVQLKIKNIDEQGICTPYDAF
ncbi:hypothetical protein J4410_06595 [Candidatus Woesearchaeota archaeon]|nr:hypothetical protein [Candidatus Woesearchaeota archaeon]